jgi:hypothetical protein
MDEQVDDFVSALSPCYDLYLALHSSRKAFPDTYSDRLCTVILTAIMGGNKRGWRVVGITRNALSHYVENDFVQKSRNGMQRAHVIPRIDTARRVLSEENPFPLRELAQLWFELDSTVLCARGENKSKLPENWIPFDNPRCELFPGLQVGWRHSKTEKDFLKALSSKHNLVT